MTKPNIITWSHSAFCQFLRRTQPVIFIFAITKGLDKHIRRGGNKRILGWLPSILREFVNVEKENGHDHADYYLPGTRKAPGGCRPAKSDAEEDADNHRNWQKNIKSESS